MTPDDERELAEFRAAKERQDRRTRLYQKAKSRAERDLANAHWDEYQAYLTKHLDDPDIQYHRTRINHRRAR
jgi:hypothetical protein